MLARMGSACDDPRRYREQVEAELLARLDRFFYRRPLPLAAATGLVVSWVIHTVVQGWG